MLLIRERLSKFLGRDNDRTMQKPPGLVAWFDGELGWPVSIGLALQHLAVQSVYFVLPAAAASFMSHDPADITRFLCLSILAAAIWQALQLLTRGPIGSGYPIPGTHTAATLGSYMLTGLAGGGFGAAGAMALVMGVVAVALVFVMQRLRVVLPNEVAGVVVTLIGVALVALATLQLGLQPGGTPPSTSALLVVFLALAVMVGIALSRTKASPFAVLIGALAGVMVSVVLGETPPNAAQVLAERPWLALPRPWALDSVPFRLRRWRPLCWLWSR